MPPGLYRGKIIDQYFTQSEKGTDGFTLVFRLLENLDHPEMPVASGPRKLTMWITDASKSIVWRQLDALGYTGKTFDGLNPTYRAFTISATRRSR
jgi:hypothetical protein